MHKTADAVVIGAGIMGAATAHFLAKRGFGQVVLLERRKLAAVSTGHSAAIIRTFYSNPVTMSLALRARAMFENDQQEIGGDCEFRRTGYLCLFEEKLGSTGEQLLQLERPEGVVANRVSSDEIRELVPGIALDEGAFGIHEPLSGYVNPVKTVQHLVERAKDWGLTSYEGVGATAIRLEGNRVSAVETDQGTIETPVAVNAAGGWGRALGLTVGLNYSLRWSRECDIVIQKPAGLGNFPVVADSNLQVYFRPNGDGHILAGLAPPKEIEPLDIDTYDPAIDEKSRTRIESGLFRRMPAWKDQPYEHGWGSMYTVTDDWHPLVGPEPALEGYYACFGGSGHGFKLGPPTGESLADMIAGAEPKINIEAFRPSRFIEGDFFTSAWGTGNRA
jgi:sarcosine oxidase subunit beta